MFSHISQIKYDFWIIKACNLKITNRQELDFLSSDDIITALQNMDKRLFNSPNEEERGNVNSEEKLNEKN